ncbi:MAG: tetratricopeptide repeat protein, partial [Nannocystaceae bacterium]|nr:tetratricopeptide repeat protein [Nannocystaceae bacterium]
MSRSAYRRQAGAAALLFVLGACDGNRPRSNTPGGADGDDPGSRMEGREDQAETAAPQVASTPKPERLRPSVQDRDPEEEKKKMAESRKQGVAARKLLAKGRLNDAIKASRNALRIHEQNVDAMLVIAQAYFRQGKLEITLAVTGSALAVDEKVRTPAETSEIHNLRAFAYDKMGKSSLATESFKEAAQADDKNAAAWNNLGTRYLAAGDTATALGCFTYALELDANFPKAHVNNGAALRASGQVEAAEKSFVKALQLKPNYGAAYFNLGVLYLDADPFPGLDTAQRLNKAIEFLSKYQSSAGSVSSGVGKKPGKGSRGAAPVSRERADDYIRVARKGIEREQRRKGREA